MVEPGKFLSVTKLNGNNYQMWKYKMELLLLKEELWNVVNDEAPAQPVPESWTLRDGKARATIGLLIEDSQIIHIRNAQTAREAWNNLKQYHEKSTLTNKVFLLKRLCRMNMPENGNMEEHVRNLMEIIDQLTALGENLAEHLQVAFLLCSLPESYSNLVTALEGRPEQDLTLELVKGKLIHEYKRKLENGGAENNELALKVFGNRFKPKKFESGSSKTCFHCKRVGHLKKDCYFLKNKKWKNNANIVKTENDNKNDDVEFCFMTATTDDGWYIDSGATNHMSSNKNLFSNYTKRWSEVELADGR